MIGSVPVIVFARGRVRIPFGVPNGDLERIPG